jgi:hypothetical protein
LRLLARLQRHDRRRRTVGYPAALLEINFTLLILGIGIGVLAGSVVDVRRPGTFVAIYLGNALSFLAPLAARAGPLRG